jgi:hypothetical protein
LPKWLVIGQRSVMGRSTLVIYIFCYPIRTTETGTANRWELLIANHLDQSLCTYQKSHHINYTLLSSAQHCSAIYQPLQIVLLCWAKAYIFWLFFIQFYFAGSHIEHRWRCSNIGTQLVWNFFKGTWYQYLPRMKKNPPDTSVAKKKTVTTSLGNTVNCKQPVFH